MKDIAKNKITVHSTSRKWENAMKKKTNKKRRQSDRKSCQY